MTDTPMLEARNLKKYYESSSSLIDSLLPGQKDLIHAVDDVSLQIRENESIGIIGESGCGKTTLLHTLLRLQRQTDGDVFYKGDNVDEFGRNEWKRFRSNVQVVFQDPFNSLNPRMTVKESILEPLKIHKMDNKEARVQEVLENVELDPPERYMNRYPDELSGGEKQRVSIARALVVEPDVLLADEPVSMLDVSTQAAVLELLGELIQKYGLSLLYISHDISTVSYVCEEIKVMYLGRIVESGPVRSIINEPKHPYTQALIGAVPVANPHVERKRVEIKGAAPTSKNLGEGCRFRDRCPERMDICDVTPLYLENESGRSVACHLYYDHDEIADMKNISQAATKGGSKDGS